MSLFDTISDDIKAAMLAKEKVRLEALRGVKKEFLEAKTAKGSDGELTDDAAIKIVQRMVKQRKDSAAIYVEQGRPELAEKELAEVAVLEEYLPKQATAKEVEKTIRDIIAHLGVTSPQEIGKVMGVASKSLAGKAEGRVISETAKRLLTDLEQTEP